MPFTFRKSDIPNLDLDIDRGSNFTSWKEEWTAYSLVSGLSKEEAETQYNVLRLAFSRETALIVSNLGLPEEKKQNVKSIIEALTEHVEGTVNETVERKAFRKRRQQKGESFDDFLVSLRDLVRTCNYCSEECTNKAIRDQIIEGISDGDTVEQLLRERKLTLETAMSISRAHESAKHQRADIKDHVIGRASVRHKVREKTMPLPRASKTKDDLTTSKKCGRCGRPWHKDIRNCPAKGKTCLKCGKLDHFASYCKSTTQSRHAPNTSPAEQQLGRLSTQGGNLMRVKNSLRSINKAPTVNVVVTGLNGSKSLEALPDSGADLTAADVNILPMLGEDVENLLKPSCGETSSVDGSSLREIGQLPVSITLGETTVEDTIHVFPSIPGGLLVSWKTAQDLQILPESYPAQIRGICKDDITEEDLINEFPTVFDGQIRTMDGEKFCIKLTDNAKPFCVNTPRFVPYAYRDKLKEEISMLEAQGVIEAVTEPTEWCAPIVVAPKKDSDDVRLCVDFSKLNKYVLREYYRSCSPAEAVANISDQQCKFFTMFDALKGYHQCPLDDASQLLTTFITPFGRYKFLRAPFGICSISEHYNRRMDEAFSGLTNYRKVVDDVLIFDCNFDSHLSRVRRFLKRCEELHISLKKEKFKFARASVKFAGYEVSQDGYKLDASLMKAISDFPTPQNITDLRSFFGLVNQLSGCSKSIASSLAPLRPLLSTKNEFLWGPDHDTAFKHCKTVLSESPTLGFFDLSRQTRLMTDASGKGLGFILQQLNGDNWSIIQAGSRFLTSAESRYATVEKEMLGVAWAIRKCHKFLAGLAHFDILTDHNPLLSILNSKRLDEIENPRLQRLRMKIVSYNFTAQWVKGSLNAGPDALSRYPTMEAVPWDQLAEETAPSIFALAAREQQRELNMRLSEVSEAAEIDTVYQKLKTVINEGFPVSKSHLPKCLADFWRVREDLSIVDDFIVYGCRLLIPFALRNDMLRKLHDSHQGIARTRDRARLAIYWPGIDQDIEKVITACKICQDELPSLGKEPMILRTPASRPFQELAVDFAYVNGQNFLIMVDCCTDWPSIHLMRSNTTSYAVISALRDYFARTAVPDVLWSDGGPQFVSHKFETFLREWGVQHKVSSPAYPQSNGKAEATVKSMKKLIRRSSTQRRLDEDKLARALLQYRNTPSVKDKLSPAQKLYGHPVQDTLPVHYTAFANEWQTKMKEAETRKSMSLEKTKRAYDRHAAPLPDIAIGSHVAIQNKDTKRFDIYGIVIAIENYRKYVVKTASGRLLVRNRKFIRKRVPASLPIFENCFGTSSPDPCDSEPIATSNDRPRRSVRKPHRLVEDPTWP